MRKPWGGWCFGGVVSDMEGMEESTSETTNIEEAENAPATEERTESVEEAAFPEAAESESPNEETESADAAAKQNAAPPILPIAAGVAALAFLLAVVLLAGKKRKASEGVRDMAYGEHFDMQFKWDQVLQDEWDKN